MFHSRLLSSSRNSWKKSCLLILQFYWHMYSSIIFLFVYSVDSCIVPSEFVISLGAVSLMNAYQDMKCTNWSKTDCRDKWRVWSQTPGMFRVCRIWKLQVTLDTSGSPIDILWGSGISRVTLWDSYESHYCKLSSIRRTLVSNRIVDHSDVVGAPPVGAAPTASSFST